MTEDTIETIRTDLDALTETVSAIRADVDMVKNDLALLQTQFDEYKAYAGPVIDGHQPAPSARSDLGGVSLAAPPIPPLPPPSQHPEPPPPPVIDPNTIK